MPSYRHKGHIARHANEAQKVTEAEKQENMKSTSPLSILLSLMAVTSLSQKATAQWDYTLYDALGTIMYNTSGDPDAPAPCCFYSGTSFQSYYSAELYDTDNNYTLFVPNDAAVDEVAALMNLNLYDLLAFSDMGDAVGYHIVPGTYTAADLSQGMTLTTLQGQALDITLDAGSVGVDGAWVVEADILADNGVIHVIDATLAPEGYPQATVVTAIAGSPDHTLFEEGIFNAYLDGYLSANALEAEDDNNGEPTTGPYTVFAPTDDAIAAFAASYGYNVADFVASQYIDDFVERHVVIGYYNSGVLSDGQSLSAMNGQSVDIEISADGVTASGSNVGAADILAYNGVVHSLDQVLPFDIPAASGTCGTWTLELYNADTYQNWLGSTIDVFKNGTLIAEETNNEIAEDFDGDYIPDAFGMSTFSFAVNEGDILDFIFDQDGGSSFNCGYVVKNESGITVFSSFSSNLDDGPDNVMGLKACGAEPTCGMIEVMFIDESQEGWVGGGMTISQGGNVQASLNFGDFNYFESLYPFSQMSTFIPVDEGEIDFIVSQPWEYAEYCGYLVKDPAGALLVNQNIEFVAPESTFGITACEAGADGVCNAEFLVEQITSPDGSAVPGAVQVSIFDYNPNAAYTWDFGDEGTSSDVFPTHQYNGPGPYTLCLTVSDGNFCSDSYCESISIDSLGILNGFLSGFTINVVDGGPSDAVSSVDDLLTPENALSVFPNPAQGQITLSGIATGTLWNAELRSMDGRLIRRFNGNGQQSLDLNGVAEGLYMLNVLDANTASRSVQVIVQ